MKIKVSMILHGVGQNGTKSRLRLGVTVQESVTEWLVWRVGGDR